MPSSLRRCLSDASMIIIRATNSGERAWRDEYLKYVPFRVRSIHFPNSMNPFFIFFFAFFVWFSTHFQWKIKNVWVLFWGAKFTQNVAPIVTTHISDVMSAIYSTLLASFFSRSCSSLFCCWRKRSRLFFSFGGHIKPNSSNNFTMPLDRYTCALYSWTIPICLFHMRIIQIESLFPANVIAWNLGGPTYRKFN